MGISSDRHSTDQGRACSWVFNVNIGMEYYYMYHCHNVVINLNNSISCFLPAWLFYRKPCLILGDMVTCWLHSYMIRLLSYVCAFCTWLQYMIRLLSYVCAFCTWLQYMIRLLSYVCAFCTWLQYTIQ